MTGHWNVAIYALEIPELSRMSTAPHPCTRLHVLRELVCKLGSTNPGRGDNLTCMPPGPGTRLKCSYALIHSMDKSLHTMHMDMTYNTFNFSQCDLSCTCVFHRDHEQLFEAQDPNTYRVATSKS